MFAYMYSLWNDQIKLMGTVHSLSDILVCGEEFVAILKGQGDGSVGKMAAVQV